MFAAMSKELSSKSNKYRNVRIHGMVESYVQEELEKTQLFGDLLAAATGETQKRKATRQKRWEYEQIQKRVHPE